MCSHFSDTFVSFYRTKLVPKLYIISSEIMVTFKTVRGTQSLHFFQSLSSKTERILCNDRSNFKWKDQIFNKSITRVCFLHITKVKGTHLPMSTKVTP